MRFLPSSFVAETVDLTRRYKLEMLWVVDDNFMVDLDRVRGIAEGLVRAESQFKWSVQATTNMVARLTHEEPDPAAPRRSAPDLSGSRFRFTDGPAVDEQNLPGL